MCGIAGIIDFRGRPDRETLGRMVASIRHRGPDAEGYLVDRNVALGHVRLSILDLSEAANQPMTRGDVSIAFNGEIYNFVELRQELESTAKFSFSTNSDTEVILAAYCHWGIEAVRRFRGMWAFALYDSAKKEVWLSRDRFGIKPLYYADTGNRICFGSEIKALLAAGHRVQPDLQEVSTFLMTGLTDYGDKTFFSGVTQLSPGTNLRIQLGGRQIKLSRYYDLSTVSSNVAVETDFEVALEEAIRLHLRSDVPIGTCLSGGLDSSTVAALSAPLYRDKANSTMTGITAASGDRNDETEYARKVIEHLGMSWFVVRPSERSFLERLGDVMRHQEQPTGGASVLMQDAVMQAAKEQGLKILLDGQGGDELLLGYVRYFTNLYRELASNGSWLTLANEILCTTRNSALSLLDIILYTTYFQFTAIKRARLNFHARAVRKDLRTAAMDTLTDRFRGEVNLRALQCREISTFQLPRLLRYEDRSSMAHSIEARVPFVDHIVVETALALSTNEKIRGGWTKYALRRIANRLLPAEIAWRKNKVGFAAPQHIWWASNLKWIEHVENASTVCRELLSGTLDAHKAMPASMRFRHFEIALWENVFMRTQGQC